MFFYLYFHFFVYLPLGLFFIIFFCLFYFLIMFFFLSEGVPRDQTRALGFFLFICTWDIVFLLFFYFLLFFLFLVLFLKFFFGVGREGGAQGPGLLGTWVPRGPGSWAPPPFPHQKKT